MQENGWMRRKCNHNNDTPIRIFLHSLLLCFGFLYLLSVKHRNFYIEYCMRRAKIKCRGIVTTVTSAAKIPAPPSCRCSFITWCWTYTIVHSTRQTLLHSSFLLHYSLFHAIPYNATIWMWFALFVFYIVFYTHLRWYTRIHTHKHSPAKAIAIEKRTWNIYVTRMKVQQQRARQDMSVNLTDSFSDSIAFIALDLAAL